MGRLTGIELISNRIPDKTKVLTFRHLQRHAKPQQAGG